MMLIFFQIFFIKKTRKNREKNKKSALAVFSFMFINKHKM